MKKRKMPCCLKVISIFYYLLAAFAVFLAVYSYIGNNVSFLEGFDATFASLFLFIAGLFFFMIAHNIPDAKPCCRVTLIGISVLVVVVSIRELLEGVWISLIFITVAYTFRII